MTAALQHRGLPVDEDPDRSATSPEAASPLACGSCQAGEPAREGARPLVVFFGVGDDRRSRVAAALLAFRARGRVQRLLVRLGGAGPL